MGNDNALILHVGPLNPVAQLQVTDETPAMHSAPLRQPPIVIEHGKQRTPKLRACLRLCSIGRSCCDGKRDCDFSCFGHRSEIR